MSVDTTTQVDYDEYIRDLSLPRLSDEERDNMEGLLTYEECKKVLETFQKDKSPGEEGFTVEFYHFFFELLGHHLITGLPYGNPSRKMGRFLRLIFLFFSVSVKVLPVTPLLSGVFVHRALLRVFS